MKFDNGTLLFYLPEILANPVMLLTLGFVIGMAITYLVKSINETNPASAKVASYTNKLDMLTNLPTQNIIARTRGIFEIIRGFNKINELVFTHKPLNNSAVSNILSSANTGNRYLMNDSSDFYSIVGNWAELKSNINAVLNKIEENSKSRSISNEEFRRDVIIEIARIKESLASQD